MLPDKVTLRHLMLDPKAERWVKDVKNTPEEIAKYYQDHLDDFKAPKKVVLRHIFLDPASDAFKAAAQVSDEELRKAFDDTFPVEQSVQLSEIRIAGGETPETQAKAKERIEAIHAKLKTGASFSALAAESNTGELATSKGDRGTVKPSELGEPLASTVKELAVGQVSPVVEGDKAFHLLLVTGKSAVEEKDPAREKEFEAKKAELSKELEADKREEAARAQLLELRASLESSDTTTPTSAFMEAARKTSQAPSAADGGELGIVALGKNEGNPKVDELGAGGYLDENITDVITELEAGNVSRPVKSARGLHLVQLAQVLPPDHRPMKDVEKEILVRLTEQKAEKAVTDAIVRIRREVAGEGPEKGGTKRTFEEIVKIESDGGDAKTGALWTDVSVGGDVEVPVDASVREETYSVNGLNPKIADAVKGLKDGELSDTITLGHTSHIYQVVSRQPKAYKPLDDAVKAEIRQALNPEVAETELIEYFEAHKTEFEEPAQVRLQHILTTDEEQAAEVLALALKGDDFGYLARKFSRDPATKNKDGEITSEVVIPAIRDAMASAEAGKVYPKIVQSHLGFHVLRLIERKPAKPASLESARAKILERLVPEKREKILRAWVDELVNQAIVKKTP
jgi:parvulin-like peptidyl-prolyl isomerase